MIILEFINIQLVININLLELEAGTIISLITINLMT